jgi:hypothetical protein
MLNKQKYNIKHYVNLIDSFLNNQIDVSTFEAKYLDTFKNDITMWSGDTYEILNGLFSDVDAFCADPELRDSEDLDEEQLRQQAQVAARKLKMLDKLSNE